MSFRSILVPVLALAGSAAQAAALIQGTVFISPSFAGGNGPFDQTLSQAGTVTINGNTTGGAASLGAGRVSADYGVIKVDGSFAGAGATTARGSFRDDLVFSASGYATGTIAQVTFQLLLDGSIDVEPSPGGALASYRLRADLGGGAFDIARTANHFNDATTLGGLDRYEGDPIGASSATVDIVLGTIEPLFVELMGTAQANFQSAFPMVASAASFHLGNSLYWGGISSFKIAGVEVDDFTVSSASGFNYRLSAVDVDGTVPEPGALALACLGLGLLMPRLRRTRAGSGLQ